MALGIGDIALGLILFVDAASQAPSGQEVLYLVTAGIVLLLFGAFGAFRILSAVRMLRLNDAWRVAGVALTAIEGAGVAALVLGALYEALAGTASAPGNLPAIAILVLLLVADGFVLFRLGGLGRFLPPSRSAAATGTSADLLAGDAGSNKFATAALILGALGFSGIPAILAVVFGAMGLQEARRIGEGRARALWGMWLGIGTFPLFVGLVLAQGA